jgi:ATP phosphoribosyltransferase
MTGNQLKLGLPAGSLQEATGELFRKAGYVVITPPSTTRRSTAL